ncbi:MAG TPA: DUF4962 domain-containing protein [Terriglobales bacterium]|nr:DUF4962 domain-containing protein [Terriglobales bacterium]
MNFWRRLVSHVAVFATVIGWCTTAVSASTEKISTPESVIPFATLLARDVTLKPELKGEHPRVFFTNAELEGLRARAHGEGATLWRESLRDMKGLREAPPSAGSPDLDKSGVQNESSYVLSQLVFAYAVERDPKYLEASKRWLKAIVSWDPWGYSYRTPNVDLPPAHLLYAVAFAYDVLYDDLTAEERAATRTKLTRQARLMYQHFRYKPNKKYSFAQNHTFIPMSGLGVAAFALMDEEAEAQEWARLVRAVYDRVLLTFDVDGYYYEGFHYHVYSLHWIQRYLDALEHSTGEDLYPAMRQKFVPLKYHLAHSILPDGKNIFDFGDSGRGASERNEHRSSRLNSGWEVLYRLAAKYRDSEAQGIADWMRSQRQKTWEPHWAFWAYEPGIKPVSMFELATSHWFQDADVVYWRSSWDKDATAFAFRCGPPQGHHVSSLLGVVPEWRLNTGHAHPDAGSFIIYAKGRYLTGDTGYTGIKLTANHNTVLINGLGQADGKHEVFKDIPYERLNRIRLREVTTTPDFFYAVADAAAAYPREAGLKKFHRHFLFEAPNQFVIWDELEADKPSKFAVLFNGDREIEKVVTGHSIINGPVSLSVETIAPQETKATVSTLFVTSQGRPGSVEKGEIEQRGKQLRIENTDPTEAMTYVHTLRIEALPRSQSSQ